VLKSDWRLDPSPVGALVPFLPLTHHAQSGSPNELVQDELPLPMLVSVAAMAQTLVLVLAPPLLLALSLALELQSTTQTLSLHFWPFWPVVLLPPNDRAKYWQHKSSEIPFDPPHCHGSVNYALLI
jgi:hypothetical protein